MQSSKGCEVVWEIPEPSTFALFASFALGGLALVRGPSSRQEVDRCGGTGGCGARVDEKQHSFELGTGRVKDLSEI